MNQSSTIIYRGLDISSYQFLVDESFEFKENNNQVDLLDNLHANNWNIIRLRIWVNPSDGIYWTDYVLNLAKLVTSKGFDLLLDFHYSDTWADPSQQTLPTSWDNSSLTTVGNEVYDYTKTTLQKFKDEGVIPAIVQIGNEISCGLLWPHGNICETASFSDLAYLLTRGKTAIHEIDPEIQIMVHTAHIQPWVHSSLIQENFQYDIMGVSYYPWWNGNLSQFQSDLTNLVSDVDKDVFVVETAYPHTMEWIDDAANIVWVDDLLDNYDASPEGQFEFLSDMVGIIEDLPKSRGIGFSYWEPFYFPTPLLPSPWENNALADYNYNLLPSASLFSVQLNTSVSLDSSTTSSTQSSKEKSDSSGLTVPMKSFMISQILLILILRRKDN